jgi:hypothetical protein
MDIKPKTKLTSQHIDALQALADALSGVTSNGLVMLKTFADSQKRTAENSLAIEKQLAKHLPANDPELLRIRKRREESERMANGITTALRRAQSLNLGNRDEHSFAGTVQNTAGARASGISVQLIASSGKGDRKIGEARTNEFGDFSINVPLSELKSNTVLKLVVENDLSETVASHPITVDPAKGTTAFTQLVLESRMQTEAGGEGDKPPKRPKSTTKDE